MPVNLVANTPFQSEGHSGTRAYTFTATWDGPMPTPALHTVQWYATGSGSDWADASDFSGGTLPSGTLTFGRLVNGRYESQQTITMYVKGDYSPEPSETFDVVLYNPSRSMDLGVSTATATITNDDRYRVGILADAPSKAEGSAGASDFTFTVRLSGAAATTETVEWTTLGSGSVDGSDFRGGGLPSGTLTFDRGEISKTMAISVAGDTDVEFDETFQVSLSNPSGGIDIGAAVAATTILDDDNTVSIRPLDGPRTEGDGGATSANFLVSLAGPAYTTRSVQWQIAGAGANPASASDFTGGVLPFGTVTFAPGETTKTVAIGVAGDAVVEPNEGYALTLSNPSAGLAVGDLSP